MQFIVMGYDGTDEDALNRRMSARKDHLDMAQKLYAAGRWLYAAALLDDDGKMVGSMIVCDFESREDLESQWLKNEAYITGKVWVKVEVQRAQVAPFCAS